MRFYTEQHQYYCGIDLHARSMYVCIRDQAGSKLVHRPIRCQREAFLRLISPYREGLVVGCECLFCWYWVADLCLEEDIPFVLGHALYMKAIHGGKSKNDRIDSDKITHLLRGGNFPYAYVYPREMRSTRDLLRRRLFFARKRGELMAHIQNTNTQYNLEPFEKRLDRLANRDELLEHFADDENVQMSIAADMALLDRYEETIVELELFLAHQAKVHDASTFYLLRSIPGIGKILSMTLLYEIHQIARFPGVGDFLSYARLVRGSWESDGKRKRGGGAGKIGNVHLKWAFSEAAALFLRLNPIGQAYFKRLERKHGKGKAMSVLAAKLGRAAFFMLRRRQPFDLKRFVAA
ncbi:MAG: IS110 family transposase [Planctomycetota bacterium]|nr:MAG: IS110 family transposase [Planctomycetota bacterium]